jgi:CDP-glucose 4,6-dehydratase
MRGNVWSSLAGRLPDAAVWNGKRVLLTGHTGFKGCWLALWLERLGAEVSGLSLAAEPGSLGDILSIEKYLPSHKVDIRESPALQEAMAAVAPEVVIHMAAQALVRPSYADPLGTFTTNVMGTAHVLEAARFVASVRAVVIVTTDKCYENREWPYPYRETDALGGHDPYSASKAGAELVTASWRRSFLAERGVAVASARAGNVIGGGDWSPDRLVPDCMRAFAQSETVRVRNPRATRPWQHVLDPLCGYLLLAETLLAGSEAAQAWNFGPSTDNIATVSDVVQLLVTHWGDGASWSADPGPHPHEAGLLAVDASQARHELDWRPRLDLCDAVRWTVDWYRRQRAGEDAAALIRAQIGDYAPSRAV